jgi:hypothetical protein
MFDRLHREPAEAAARSEPAGDRRRPPPVQRKLVVGSADDRLEQEADRVAAIVTTRLRLGDEPVSQESGSPGTATSRIRRSTARPLQPSTVGPEGGPLDEGTASRIRRSTGRPLDRQTRSRMESAFDADLSAVRVHTDGEAADLSRSLGAQAFTTGTDIFFGAGTYRPASSSGAHLLAHELAHTVQQSGVRRRTMDVGGGGFIHRKLNTMASAAPTRPEVKAHLDSIQDTGRTFTAEARFVLDVIKLSPGIIPTLVTRAEAFRTAMRTGTPAVMMAEINLFAGAVNTEYDALMEEAADLRRRYKDIQDKLRAKLNASGAFARLMLSNEDDLLVRAHTKIQQANLKADNDQLVRALVEFQDWLATEDYGYAYTDWVSSSKAGERADEPEAAALPDGTVSRATLAAVAPNGATAGQRYGPDRGWHGTHRYHVSVSFTIPDDATNRRRKPAQRWHVIENFHVTFTANNNPGQVENTKARYWWHRLGPGRFEYHEQSGGPHSPGMEADARTAVTAIATDLGCDG